MEQTTLLCGMITGVVQIMISMVPEWTHPERSLIQQVSPYPLQLMANIPPPLPLMEQTTLSYGMIRAVVQQIFTVPGWTHLARSLIHQVSPYPLRVMLNILPPLPLMEQTTLLCGMITGVAQIMISMVPEWTHPERSLIHQVSPFPLQLMTKGGPPLPLMEQTTLLCGMIIVIVHGIFMVPG